MDRSSSVSRVLILVLFFNLLVAVAKIALGLVLGGHAGALVG